MCRCDLEGLVSRVGSGRRIATAHAQIAPFWTLSEIGLWSEAVRCLGSQRGVSCVWGPFWFPFGSPLCAGLRFLLGWFGAPRAPVVVGVFVSEGVLGTPFPSVTLG